ncbi:hypothetical protein QJS10_CPB13g01409 [Acorus calamus]|uniref:Myb/SANT-like DNA-binding domain-containing protein n=1 Tax=Acorus calamus TaxID=4465 RepID=A0AAV9DJ77_ACOCL|nr:hypothetical protein QJS10_CPB13g01409 [Acorus calamus]
MEGNLIPGNNYGMVDYHHHHLHQQQQNPHQLNQNPQPQHPSITEMFPLSVGGGHVDCDHNPMPFSDYKPLERPKTSMSDDDDDGAHVESGNPRKGSPWQRMKWNDSMVKLLITAVSYIGEDMDTGGGGNAGGGKRKCSVMQKKGKWKSVSKVMATRGCFVSPQQCEDKFNDLNKRYKRLTDILGRGTSCKVVENPTLLDSMDRLSEKAKDDVRKILSSKHLFYEEMCSYHNGNRLHLPDDPMLQRSLQLALRSRDDGAEEGDGEAEEGDVETEMNEDVGSGGCFPKRVKQCQNVGDGHGGFQMEGVSVDMNQVYGEGSKVGWSQKGLIKSRLMQLEEQKIQIQAQMVELERQRFKWQRFSRKKDRELDKMRIENEKMKLENERMAFELKQREMEADN